MKRRILGDCRRLPFYNYFADIVETVNDKLKHNKYSPNNIRDTFINNAYKQGVKLGYSIPEIAAIAGNSYKTAIKHYRDSNDIEDYVEALCKVVISNVDINGKILIEEKDVDSKIVRENLGTCVEKKCNYEIAECLICNHFATYIDRIPFFHNFIDNINEELRNTIDEDYVNELNTLKKVAAKYLAELYKIMNEKDSRKSVKASR